MTTEELIAELESVLAAASAPNGYMTLKDIACAWHGTVLANGSQIRRTRDALGVLKAQGRIAHIAVKREGLDGRMSSVPAYRVLPE